ncbi:MAG: hypothetical protein RIT27_1772 [Pseudomonadota bacterium]|jgi:transcriptional regulator with XRE-family HTH domain
MQRKLHFKRLDGDIPHRKVDIFLEFLIFSLKWSVFMEVFEKTKEILENIKHFRQCQNLTQDQIAEQLEIASNTYGSVERGETELSVPRLIKIANILHIPPELLFNSNQEKFIFNSFIRVSESSNNIQHLYTNTSMEQLKSKYEIEKQQILIEQQAKEISHLNKIISLMEKQLEEKK